MSIITHRKKKPAKKKTAKKKALKMPTPPATPEPIITTRQLIGALARMVETTRNKRQKEVLGMAISTIAELLMVMTWQPAVTMPESQAGLLLSYGDGEDKPATAWLRLPPTPVSNVPKICPYCGANGVHAVPAKNKKKKSGALTCPNCKKEWSFKA